MIETIRTNDGDIEFKIEHVTAKRVMVVKAGATIYDLYRILGVVPYSGRKILKDIKIEFEQE